MTITDDELLDLESDNHPTTNTDRTDDGWLMSVMVSGDKISRGEKWETYDEYPTHHRLHS